MHHLHLYITHEGFNEVVVFTANVYILAFLRLTLNLVFLLLTEILEINYHCLKKLKIYLNKKYLRYYHKNCRLILLTSRKTKHKKVLRLS